jgi:hypothetical protein
MGLLLSIASLTFVSIKLSDDRGFMHHDLVDSVRLVLSATVQHLDHALLCRGELPVTYRACYSDED